MEQDHRPSTSSLQESSANKKWTYAVIEFSLNFTLYVSSCPVSWINGSTCFWPSKKGMERKAIMHEMNPEKDWITLENIRILGKYSTYKEALYYEKKKTAVTSSEESEEEFVRGNRKNRRNSKYRDDSISPPPIAENFEDGNTVNSKENNNEGNSASFSQFINDAEITIVNEKSCDDIWELLMQMKVQQDLIIERLGFLEQLVSNGPCTMPFNSTDPLPKFPLGTVVELNEFEEKLKNDETVQNCLFKYLQFVGGNDYKLCIYRCLEKLFSNYLGQFCSWTGKKGNLKLSGTELIKVVQKAVKLLFPQTTDHFFETCIRAWFNHAKTRYTRQTRT